MEIQSAEDKIDIGEFTFDKENRIEDYPFLNHN